MSTRQMLTDSAERIFADHCTKALLDRAQEGEFPEEKIEAIRQDVKKHYQLDDRDLEYFVYSGKVSNTAYKSDPFGIRILYKSGEVADIKDASDSGSIKAFSHDTVKYFLCYPKKYS